MCCQPSSMRRTSGALASDSSIFEGSLPRLLQNPDGPRLQPPQWARVLDEPARLDACRQILGERDDEAAFPSFSEASTTTPETSRSRRESDDPAEPLLSTPVTRLVIDLTPPTSLARQPSTSGARTGARRAQSSSSAGRPRGRAACFGLQLLHGVTACDEGRQGADDIVQHGAIPLGEHDSPVARDRFDARTASATPLSSVIRKHPMSPVARTSACRRRAPF